METVKFEMWADFLTNIRAFMKGRHFVYLPTPTRLRAQAIEPHIVPYSSEGLVLPTSPELSLKKGLAQGLNQVYDLRPVFRNELLGPHHANEFWMLEWYRNFESLAKIQEDLIALVSLLCPFDFKIESTTWSELFQKKLDFNLTPRTQASELQILCQSLELHFDSKDSFDDLFFRLVIEKIESSFDPKVMTIVRNFPPSQCALAEINEAGWADRIEMYFKGLEIANAYQELTDPGEQKRRFEKANLLKLKMGQLSAPIDQSFLEALKKIKKAAGIALGVERLFMGIHGITNIKEVPTQFFEEFTECI